MFLAPGQIVTLHEIILGLAVSSGNDAAVAAALRLAPSVDSFAGMMTREARRMGLTRTSFVEPSGISEYNMTTAAEFASFSREYMLLYPNILTEYHSVSEFAYPKAHKVAEPFRNNPGTLGQANRNTLLRTFSGVDGLKTGDIDEAGYTIALTAQRNGTRFIAVILGAPANPGGARIRDRDGERLLSWAFENFKTVRPGIPPLEPVKLWKGKEKSVDLHTTESAVFTAPFNRAETINYVVEIYDPLVAPLQAFQHIGWLVLHDEEGELKRIRLITAREYQQGNIFRRIWDSLRLFLQKKGRGK
jgi:D-alanyl-D-alanine carboxypeptidase (penicillin-binding protein 5/6)